MNVRWFIILFMCTSCTIYSPEAIQPNQKEIDTEIGEDRFKKANKNNYKILLKNGKKIKRGSIQKIDADSVYFYYLKDVSYGRAVDSVFFAVHRNEIASIKYKDVGSSIAINVIGIGLTTWAIVAALNWDLPVIP
jgi:hypothetical protein